MENKLSEQKQSDIDISEEKSSNMNEQYVPRVRVFKLVTYNVNNVIKIMIVLLPKNEQFQQKHTFKSPEQTFIMKLYEQ